MKRKVLHTDVWVTIASGIYLVSDVWWAKKYFSQLFFLHWFMIPTWTDTPFSHTLLHSLLTLLASLKHLYVPASLLQSWSAWPHAQHPSIKPRFEISIFTVSSSKLAYWNSFWYEWIIVNNYYCCYLIGFCWLLLGSGGF